MPEGKTNISPLIGLHHMNLYIVHKWDESNDNFPIEGIFDNEDSARAACLTPHHCYNTIPLELNRDYSSTPDMNPNWVYPLEDGSDAASDDAPKKLLVIKAPSSTAPDAFDTIRQCLNDAVRGTEYRVMLLVKDKMSTYSNDWELTVL